MKEIRLINGQTTYVSDEDYERVSQYSWRNHGQYAATLIDSKTVLLHRFILGLEVGDKRQGDHINRNTFDNRRENLRIVTSQQQNRNKPRRKDNTSGCIGVSWNKRRGKYHGYAHDQDGVKRHVGYFDDPVELGLKVAAKRLEFGTLLVMPPSSEQT